jgi:hypothetical protein
MSEHIVKSYDEELNSLKQLLLEMTELSLNQIKKVYDGMVNKNNQCLPL